MQGSNNSQGFPKNGSPTRESITTEELEAIQADRRRVLAAEVARKKAEQKEQYPEIQTSYEPDVWRQNYEGHPMLHVSVNRFMATTPFLPYEDAKKTLLNILVTTTYIESNLTRNGAQTAEELFENLLLSKNDHPIPFETSENVATFCDSMPLNFRKNGTRYRNTGVQGRKLVQWLKERLDCGDIIDRDSFHEIKTSFCNTIEVTPKLQSFAHQEPGLDFSSLFHLAKCIPGFKYDKATGRLSLSSEATVSLALNVPILTDTLNSNHITKIDFSRWTSGFAINERLGYPSRREFVMVSEKLSGVTAAFYTTHLEQSSVGIERNFSFVQGFVSSNSIHQQAEVFTVEPTNYSYANNLCTESSGQSLDGYGKLETTDFVTFALHQRHFHNKTVSRPIIVKKKESVVPDAEIQEASGDK